MKMTISNNSFVCVVYLQILVDNVIFFDVFFIWLTMSYSDINYFRINLIRRVLIIRLLFGCYFCFA